MRSAQTSVFILHKHKQKGQKRCFTFLTLALDQCRLPFSPASYLSTTPGTNWIEGRVGLNVTLHKVAFRKLQFSPSSPPKQHMRQI